MALWVLHERCFGSAPNEAMRTSYVNDPFIRKLRAKNLMEHFLADTTYAQRADALLETDHILAGQFGGIAFEQIVRKRAPRGKDWDEKDPFQIIEDLHSERTINESTRGMWQQARLIRNRAIHMNPPPTFPQVKQLIELLNLSARE